MIGRRDVLVLEHASELRNILTEVAGLAGEGVELLLVGPLLIVGGGDDEEAPPPAKPATTEGEGRRLNGTGHRGSNMTDPKPNGCEKFVPRPEI